MSGPFPRFGFGLLFSTYLVSVGYGAAYRRVRRPIRFAYLQVSIDLVLASGERNGPSLGFPDLWIVDYKTGSQRGFNLRESRKGESSEQKFQRQLVDGRGVQLALYALAAHVYPTSIRATGVGTAVGFGRIGGVLSPSVGQWALDSGGASGYFRLIAITMSAAFVALAAVGRHIPRAAVANAADFGSSKFKVQSAK